MFFCHMYSCHVITSIFKGPAGTRVEIVDLIREKDFAASIQLGWIEIARPHVMLVVKEEIMARYQKVSHFKFLHYIFISFQAFNSFEKNFHLTFKELARTGYALVSIIKELECAENTGIGWKKIANQPVAFVKLDIGPWFLDLGPWFLDFGQWFHDMCRDIYFGPWFWYF